METGLEKNRMPAPENEPEEAEQDRELQEKEEAILAEVDREAAVLEPAPAGADPQKWEKLKPVAAALLGLTIFAGSVGLNVEKAEAGDYHHKNEVISRVEKDVARGLGRGIENTLNNLFRRAGVISDSEMRRDRMDARNMQKRIWQDQYNETKRQIREIERMENQALQDYNQDIKRAKTNEEMELAKKKLDLKMQQIKEFKQGGSMQDGPR